MKRGRKGGRNKSPCKEFSERLMAMLSESGETQTKTAAILGETRQTYNNWITGATEPSLAKLVSLSKHYKVSADYLLGLTDVRKVSRVAQWIDFPECLKFKDAYSCNDIACSGCGGVYNVLDNDVERFRYCPNCGAKMERETG